MTTENHHTKLLEKELQFYGEKAAEIMQDLSKKVNNISSAMLCTPEGFNICSMGFEDEDVAKMAAVSSSLHAMAQSVLVAFSNKKTSVVDTISVKSDDIDVLGKLIHLPDKKSLILIIASKGSTAGLQLYAAQFVEDALKASLEENN